MSRSSSTIPFPFLLLLLVALVVTWRPAVEKVGDVTVGEKTFSQVELIRGDKKLAYRADNLIFTVDHDGPKLYVSDNRSSLRREPTLEEVTLWKKYFGDPEKLQDAPR